MDQQQQIETAIKELFNRERDFEAACKGFAEAEHSYRMAKAEAYLSATGTVDERKAKMDKLNPTFVSLVS